MIAFFIDADNFSSPAWIDEAFRKLEKTEGTISIRRAYGSAENLKGLSETLRVWAVRPYVNLPIPKNTTDMSLAVDAMEVACTTPSPQQIVIGSGDLDFVPLVVRLRERGIKVVCVTERSKFALDAVRAYDQVIYVGGDQVDATKVEMAKHSVVTPVRPTPKKSTIKAPASKTTGAKKLVAKKAVAKKADVENKKSLADESVTVRDILSAVPNLTSGQWLPLRDVAKLLHDKKILAKNATSTKVFKKFPHHFELMPTGKPHQVRLILQTM